MHRRRFLETAAIGSAAALIGFPVLKAEAASHLKIKKIRYYAAPGYNKPNFNQARGIVEIETDGGVIGIGEGGSKDMIEQCAQMMIGEDPFRIEHIWQDSVPRYVLSSRPRKAGCYRRFRNGAMGY